MKLKKWHMYVSLYAILLSTIFCSVFLCFNILPTHAASLTVGTLDKEEYFVVNNGYLAGLSSSGTEVANNYDLLNVIIPDGVTNFSSSGFIYQYQTQIESIVLPASLTNIESSTFTVCSNLKSVDLSNTSVARIGYRAFYNCTNLSNIKFPNSLTAIESEAFAGCNNLISLDLSDTNITSIYYRTLYKCTNLTTIQFPDSLSVIETDAFFECNSLENINLSNTNVSSIKYRAFSNCNSLTSVSFPNSLTTVQTNSFSGCNSLKSVDLSNTNVTVIEYCTFYDCTNLTNVVLPESLTNIESSAFSECNNIEVFICPNPDVFENCKDEISNLYTDKVIYNIGVQFNLTDHENNQSVFYEKILVSEDLKDWHFINGEWIVDPDYVYGEGLPTLPYGYIWQDEFGYELTAERIQALLIEAENQNELMTINVSAVEKPKKLITITG